MQDKRIEQRVRAAYCARACAAGVACGAQIFAVGTGLLLPLALNAAYWAAVPALLLGGVIGLAAPRRLSKAPGSAFCAVLALSLLVCGALLLAAGATLAQQTLLPNGHLLTCLMLTLGFCLLAARPGGTGVCRVAFALRWLLPAALAVFAGLSLSSSSMAGLFPLLGAGVRSLGLSALLSLSACSPALMLFLPPQELETPAPVPKAGFFALRVVLGGLFGVLTLAALSLCNPYALLRDQHVWGARMTILSSARPREGLVQALLTLAQLFALLIGAVSTLCAAAQALAQYLGVARLAEQLGMRLRGKGTALVALHAGHPDAEDSCENALREPVAPPQGHDLVRPGDVPGLAVGRIHLLEIAIHGCRITDAVAAQGANRIPELVGYGDAPDIDRLANRNHRGIDLVVAGIADGSHGFRQVRAPPFETDTTIGARLHETRRTPLARIPTRRKPPA